MSILEELKPTDVFRYFEALTQIPRESGNEQAVSDYLVAFATEHQLEVIQEPCLNVIIKKPATKGYEQAPGVILQGHMDMVCVKEDQLDFDFQSQPIPIKVEGDYIKTEGTTLGADNGIAVAMAMAILTDQTLEHPALTVLVTTEEETGMDGVMALEPAHVEGQILINLDSEEEGVALVSCAGGVRNQLTLPLVWQEAVHDIFVDVVISGLNGGHSGVEIDKNRANAIKLLGRLLVDLNKTLNVKVAHVSGGEKMNAISKRAVVTLNVASEQVDTLKERVVELEAIFKNEFSLAEPTLAVTVIEAEKTTHVLDDATTKALVSLLTLVPFGPQTMSEGMRGLVESSINPGVLTLTDDVITLNCATRSSVASLKEEINTRLEVMASLVGATHELIADYPEWQYVDVSPIRDLMQAVYLKTTGKELKISAIHAGLECGFISEKLGTIDMISIGPDMQHVHTPKEMLSISSTARVYEFLCHVLKEIK